MGGGVLMGLSHRHEKLLVLPVLVKMMNIQYENVLVITTLQLILVVGQGRENVFLVVVVNLGGAEPG